MEVVGTSLLSGLLQVVFDCIAANRKFLLGLFPGNKKLQLNRLIRSLRTISEVLDDAENKHGISSDVETWFNNLQHAVYLADDVLDEINTERLRIKLQHSKGNMSDTDFRNHFIGELSPRLEEICDALERKVQQIGVLGLQISCGKQKREDNQPSTSVVIQSQIFGRDDEKEKIMKTVLSCKGGTDISVIPIVGMGGIGKTTLAQLVYDDERVKNHFETRACVCVCGEFDVYKDIKNLLMEINSSVFDEKDDLDRLQVKLRDNLEGKRFIIILDDIWNEDHNYYQHLMTPLNSGSRGSKILVTTRNQDIALMLQSEPFHLVRPISYEQSWSLFKLHAFDNRARTLSPEFETIGRTIVEKCEGLPLLIKILAGGLCSKDDIVEWCDISSSDNRMRSDDMFYTTSMCYKLLPPRLKWCFAFCAIFHSDFSFDKKEVALLWMANDLIQPSSQKVAQNYFEELRSRSFFEIGNNKKYLMHDLVYELGLIVSGIFCARIGGYELKVLRGETEGENDLPLELLHFSYRSSRYDSLKTFRWLARVKGLRTFLPVHQFDKACITTLFFSDILPKLRLIRALSLHRYGISVIPDSIGNLKHLRFLNLARNCMKRLPNDITKCMNLQTLILAGCWNLRELPEDMGLLINLQHLDLSYCSKLEELPRDMRLLIDLQHLDIRGAGFNFIDKMEIWLSELKDIQNLSIVVDEIHGNAVEQLDKLQLGQLFKISGLDNAVTVEMAKIVELKNKNFIENLSLEWNGIRECSEDELNIFEELIPHTNIRQLSIKGYRGKTFSNWLGDSSFCNMESLTLTDCNNCFHLPPLGQLTGLKKLEIYGMDGITEVGEEFYGNSSICKPFQVLEKLRFSNMAEWTTWSMHPENVGFLSLKECWVTDCPKLGGDIPFHLTSLRTLQMKGLHSLHCNQEASFLSSTLQEARSSNMSRLKNMTQGIEYLEIKDCPTISLSLRSCDVKRVVMGRCKHVEFPTYDICNSSLKSFEIHGCCGSTEAIPLFSFSKLQELFISSWENPNMFQFPYGYHQSLTSLQYLRISDCNKISSFPKGGLPAPNLKEFTVSSCNKLKSLPEQMYTQLSSLRHLSISNCPEMECFPDGGLPPSLKILLVESCKKLMMVRTDWGLHRLPSLIELFIIGFEDKLFPEEGLLSGSLQRLHIEDCHNLEALNHKGFQDVYNCPITSLKDLYINRCPELSYLPEDGLASSLSTLSICNCPKLKARIEREKGEDWPKVSHIPNIEVDGELVS